jgi:hypothetical protein
MSGVNKLDGIGNYGVWKSKTRTIYRKGAFHALQREQAQSSIWAKMLPYTKTMMF